MEYRDDLDRFAQRRARDDHEAWLLASFCRAERVRRTRWLASWLGVATAVGLAICAWPWLDAHGDERAARPPPLAILGPLDPAKVSAERERLACLARAVRRYRAWMSQPQWNVAGDPGPHWSLETFAGPCAVATREAR
jgi:hypothetical protein